ncbi:hypothetical protein [Paenibacillus anseongense]|uniref:hypothetical protein n=1 Tax=Paenibacillus anseongense TaxID=2682845 RepID=UPI002DBD7FD5|nr:hypothetical protein [Paenibacillus anseongense]MEC0269718.1 hypothetical protein [Paenibacillus anseongense]
MQISYRQFPHPVLSFFSDDVQDVDFQTSLKNTKTQNTYIFEASCFTSSDDLNGYLAERKACFAFHFECSSTRYRRMFTSYEEMFSFEIQADELEGKVQICAFILAAEDIERYSLSEFHEDYEGHSFSINKGDVLAIDTERTFFADKEVDPLKRIPSIFSVVPSHDEDALPLDFDSSGNKVIIKLSNDNFDKYKYLSVSQHLQPLLLSLVILPVLVSLLEMIKDSEDSYEYEDFRWYQVIRAKLKSMNIDLVNCNESMVVVGQKLVGDPVTLSLDALESVEEEG